MSKLETFHVQGSFTYNREWMEALFTSEDLMIVIITIPPYLKYLLNNKDEKQVKNCLCFLYKFLKITPESIKKAFLKDLEDEVGIKIEDNMINKEIDKNTINSEGLH